MRADNREQLITAARRRHQPTPSKALQALHELVTAGEAVTFQTVADRAGVSRSWLYAHDDIKAEIQRHRTRAAPPSPPVPTRQRAREASLTRRLAVAVERNRQLAEENGARAANSKPPSATPDTPAGIALRYRSDRADQPIKPSLPTRRGPSTTHRSQQTPPSRPNHSR
jgi:Family of unknown function (DUF6262)